MKIKARSMALTALLPFSFPIILKELGYKKKETLVLIAFILALISFTYLPYVTSDKATYYGYYEYYADMSLIEFLNFLIIGRADYVFHFFIYLFSTFNIPFHFLFLIITYTTVFIWYDIFYEIIAKQNIGSKQYIFFFLLLVFSFSVSSLLSGVRFYLAVTISLSGLYRGILKERKINGIILILLSSIIHYGCLIFLPAYFVFVFFKNNHKLFLIIFLVSFTFLALPKEFLLEKFEKLNLIETRQTRIDNYLGNEDLIERGLKTLNTNYLIQYSINMAWIYFAYLYILLTIKRKSMLRDIFYITFAISNLFYASPVIYNRYIILVKSLFILLIINEYYLNYKYKKLIHSIFFVFLLSFFVNIYVIRVPLIKSIFQIENATLPTTLLKKDFQTKDFIEVK